MGYFILYSNSNSSVTQQRIGFEQPTQMPWGVSNTYNVAACAVLSSYRYISSSHAPHYYARIYNFSCTIGNIWNDTTQVTANSSKLKNFKARLKRTYTERCLYTDTFAQHGNISSLFCVDFLEASTVYVLSKWIVFPFIGGNERNSSVCGAE